MQSKTIIIGDCHIGAGTSIGRSLGNSLNSRIIDQFNILDWILSTALEREVSRFVFTGDLFEEMKPDHNIVVKFIDWLKDCSINGVECHIIAGNHDLKRVGSKYSSVLDIIEAADIENVWIYNHIYTLESEGANFTFLPFRDRRSLSASSCLEGINKIEELIQFESSFDNSVKKILVGHVAIEKSFYTDEVDDISNELMFPLSSFEGFDYVWMGHVHNPQIMQKKPLIEHVGSMDLSDFGETKHVKNLILYDSKTDTIERIPIPSRPLRRIRLEISDDKDPTESVINEILKTNKDYPFENSIVKFEIKITNPDSNQIDRKKILDVLSELKISHVASFSESRAMVIVPASKMQIQDTSISPKDAVKLISNVFEYENEEEKDEFLSICNSIIEEADQS